MRKFEKVDIIAGLIADIFWLFFLIALSAIFLIIPSVAVFVQGYGGGWLIMTFLFVPCIFMIYDCINSFRKGLRKLKKR